MTILKFGATWCPGCIIMKPRWAKIEAAYAAHGLKLDTHFYDFDAPDAQEMVKKYDVDADTGKLPMFIWLGQDGKELYRLFGEVEEDELMDTTDRVLANEGVKSPRAEIRAEQKSKRNWFQKLFNL